MSYDGYFTLAGMELVNAERTRSYIRNLLPTVKVEDPCTGECSCTNLPSLLGHGDYSTPFIDAAPWYDADQPESGDFLGFYPTKIVGLSDDTITSEVIESGDDGGWISSQRREVREVRFSGVLVSNSGEGAHYGETWLKAILDGACNDGCGGAGDNLCFLTACVDPQDFGGKPQWLTLSPYDFVTSDSARVIDDTLQLPSTRSWAELTVPGGVDSCGPVEWEFDVDVTKGGSWLLVDHDGVTDQFWMPRGQNLIKVTSQETTVRFRAAVGDSSGLQKPLGASWTPQPSGGAHWAVGAAPAAAWTPAAETHVEGVDLHIMFESIWTTSRSAASDDDCRDDVLRTLRRVKRTEGPVFGPQDSLPSGAVLREVSFIITAQSPFIYGQPEVVVSGPMLRAARADVRVQQLPSNIAPCKNTRPPAMRDPQRPGIPKPPYPEPPVDRLRQSVINAGIGSQPYGVLIPDHMISDWRSSVPVIEISTGSKDVRFVSVAFYPVPHPKFAFGDIDPCSACGTFEVAYIPANSTFTVDATAERGWIEQAGGTFPGSGLITDAQGRGKATWPELSCGSSYLAVIDTHGQTLMDVTLSLAVRE